MREYTTFSSFWPYYLREHARPATRHWHYVGSTLAILVLVVALVTQTWWVLLAVPVAGYFFAWVSHAFIERNKPAPAAAPLPTVGSAAAKPDDGYEYMDVPAFLRRQAN